MVAGWVIVERLGPRFVTCGAGSSMLAGAISDF